MSVFDEAATEQPVEETTTQQTQEETYLAKLVKERGENWSDPEVIAKGKLEADVHISNLEQQLAELREDLDKKSYTAAVEASLQNRASSANSNPAGNDHGNDADPDTNGEAGESLESLVEQTLQKRDAAEKVKRNLEAVEASLIQSFGTEAVSKVRDRAKELGMSVDRLREVAEESPNAFLSLVGQPPLMQRNADTSSTKNSIASFNGSSNRDFQYYQNLRRSNPKQYYSPSIQNEMADSRVKMGEKFFNP